MEQNNKENLNPDQPSKYVELAREKFESAQYLDSLKLLKKAYSLNPSSKITRKIERIEQFLAEKPVPDKNCVDICENDSFTVDKCIWEKLYKHQQDGIKWLWSIHRRSNQVGGILADDMGLGKTIQIVVFINELLNQDHIQNCLIVLPVALIINWTKEFERWAPTQRVLTYHGNKMAEKKRNLSKIQKRGGILLTSYGILVNDWEYIGGNFDWDYVILDEGHKIKNPSTKSAKAAQAINANRRILLTGTAVQNNLDELWALFDFTHQGALLGSKATFKMEYANPINKSRMKDATSAEQNYGLKMSHSLRKIIEPYFLRRTKAQVKLSEEEAKSTNSNQNVMKMPSMTRKNDLVVWVYLSSIQERIYRDFLQLDDVKELLTGRIKRSPLMELTVLKKICDHPRLLSSNQCSALGLMTHQEYRNQELKDECAANQIHNISDDVLIEESGKLQFLIELTKDFKTNGNRLLIFSQSRKILDVISQLLRNNDIRHLRLDGTVTKLTERDEILAKFSSHTKYTAMLLTTQVGGVGLTITAADRVVIYDPSWNPATDAQAVDRVFRIGQQKNVIIYRLVTCGTVEEKIYRRQIFKDSITRQTTGVCSKTDNNPYRYFSHQDLLELFLLDDSRRSSTQEQLAELHMGQRLTDPSLDDHLAFIHSLPMFGISDHDLMFSQGASLESVEEPVVQFVESRRIQAEQRLAEESQENESERSMRIMMSRMDLSCASMDTSLRATSKIPPGQRNQPSQYFQPNMNSTIMPTFKKPILPTMEKGSNQFIKPHPVRTANSLTTNAAPPSEQPIKFKLDGSMPNMLEVKKPPSVNTTSKIPEQRNPPSEFFPLKPVLSKDKPRGYNDFQFLFDRSQPVKTSKSLIKDDTLPSMLKPVEIIDKKDDDRKPSNDSEYRDASHLDSSNSNSEDYTTSDNSSVVDLRNDSLPSVVDGETFFTPASTPFKLENDKKIVPLNDLNTSHKVVTSDEHGTASLSAESEKQIVDSIVNVSIDEDVVRAQPVTPTLDLADADRISSGEEGDRNQDDASEDDEEEYDYEDESGVEQSMIDLDDIDDCDEEYLVKSILETYNRSFQLEAQSPRPSNNRFIALFDVPDASLNQSSTDKDAVPLLLEDSVDESIDA